MQPYGPYRNIKDSDLYPYLSKPLPAGVLEHQYVNASDDIAAYSADQCGRQAVTAQFAWDNLCDATLYLYIETNEGTDPWLTIDGGMDVLNTQGNRFCQQNTTARESEGANAVQYFVLCFGRTGEFKVTPEHRVFVSKKVIQRVLEGK